MTDSRRPMPFSPDVQRWPRDPAQLVDTTLCPSCFSSLTSTTCGVCGLELAVPAASDLLAASTRVYDAEQRRQEIITRMRAEQEAAARAAPSPEPVAMPVAMPVAVGAVVPSAEAAAVTPIVADSPHARPIAAPAPPVHGPGVATAPPAGAAGAPGTTAPVPPKPHRSGVQVLLLVLGVVLLSVAAIVFLFVAYLVASLELRSVIIATASVLVLGLAWLLRARRLPGTAEGVASVAVVLLLLDVWIVRENGLFGTDALRATAYWGAALLVVATLLAATRRVSAVRVPGFAAAGIAPVAVFLLATGAVPESDLETGLWLGCLAASLAGSASVFVRPGVERTVMLAEGFAAGSLAFIAASWALPDVAWNVTWTYGGVAFAWLVAVIALRLQRVRLSRAWSGVAGAALGLATAFAPVAGIVRESDAGPAAWLAPAAAAVVMCVFAAATRLRSAPIEAWTAFFTTGAITAATAVPAIVAGSVAIVMLLSTAVDPWGLAGDQARSAALPELDVAATSVPIIIAVAALIVLWLLGRFRALAALPLGAVLFAVLVAAGLAPGVTASELILLALATGGLAAATTPTAHSIRGVVTTIAAFGIVAAAIAWWISHSSTDVWWWAITAVLALAIAGRVLAPRVWSAGAAPVLGILHLATAATVAAIALPTVTFWAEAASLQLPTPWDSPWIWAGTGSAVLLAALAFARRLAPGDRIALVAPFLLAALLSITALVIAPSPAYGWLPAALLTVTGLLWAQPTAPRALGVAFAAATPLALGLAIAGAADEFAGPEYVALGLAGAALLAAGSAHVVVRRLNRATVAAWGGMVGLLGLVASAIGFAGPYAADEPWLVMLLLTPVPLIIAAIDGDPIGGGSPLRHLSWITLALGVVTVWTWLAGDAVDDVEAYSLPLAAALAIAGALITWRRSAPAPTASGRTTLFASAAAVAVLPSVGSSADSELRTLVLCALGVVVLIASVFLPERARGVPVRLILLGAGWTAVTGAALVRGCAIASGEPSALIPEFWPLIALAAGVVAAVAWARIGSSPAALAESLLAASVVLACVPTVLAILAGENATARAAVLFAALAGVHVASVATSARPFRGPLLGWGSLGALVVGSALALWSGTVDPFDVATAPIGAALIGAGAIRMHRSPALGSWPALGPGLAVLLLPALIADWTDPELWRIVALGVVAVAAVVAGAVGRLQAPLLLGGAVLLVHATNQLWPWITWLYEAVWWWLWLAIAGALLIALAATYERQLRLARGVVRSIAALR